jgi:RsiW-degrading membrane proteinase PrsW (M82 family)
MILKIFFCGMLVAIPAAFVEMEFFNLTVEMDYFPIIIINFLKIFIGVAFVEEFSKYLVVRIKVLKNSEFDEPIDAMIYMIIAALGFAASENFLFLLFGLGEKFLFIPTFSTAVSRFLTATFLHTLCSAIIGYFLALSLHETKRKNILLVLGIGTGTFLHGLYNFYIISNEGKCGILILFTALSGLAIFVTFGFRKLRKMKSICKI